MPRWVLLLSVASTLAIAIVLGVLWYVIGGWPRDHDRYGRVSIPGQETLELPKGDIRLSFEGQVSGGGQTRTLEDPPEGLEVRVTPSEGEPLEVKRVSGSLYGVLSGDRGHEPYGETEVPSSGRYRVRARAEGASPGGGITVGPELWNPLGSRLVGAVVIFVVALVALLLLELPLVLIAARRRA